jgi:hypothetical protein
MRLWMICEFWLLCPVQAHSPPPAGVRMLLWTAIFKSFDSSQDSDEEGNSHQDIQTAELEVAAESDLQMEVSQ